VSKCVCGDPAGGAYSAPQNPTAEFGEGDRDGKFYVKGTGGEERKGEKWERREGE